MNKRSLLMVTRAHPVDSVKAGVCVCECVRVCLSERDRIRQTGTVIVKRQMCVHAFRLKQQHVASGPHLRPPSLACASLSHSQHTHTHILQQVTPDPDLYSQNYVFTLKQGFEVVKMSPLFKKKKHVLP